MKEEINKLKNDKENNLVVNNDVFISCKNMLGLLQIIKKYKKSPNILITPYLINEKISKIYELHNYEFDIEISANKKMKKDFNKNNILPKVITQNLTSGILVDEWEYEYAYNFLEGYLDAMNAMQFKIERSDPVLKNAKLYYQIF